MSEEDVSSIHQLRQKEQLRRLEELLSIQKKELEEALSKSYSHDEEKVSAKSPTQKTTASKENERNNFRSTLTQSVLNGNYDENKLLQNFNTETRNRGNSVESGCEAISESSICGSVDEEVIVRKVTQTLQNKILEDLGESLQGSLQVPGLHLHRVDSFMIAPEDDRYEQPILNDPRDPSFVWTREHFRLLYLISLYSNCAAFSGGKDKYVRNVPLLVLIYEGIVNEVFDYDYAPCSEIVGKNAKRVYMNISQEGRDDLDDLREAGFVNGLKLSSKEYNSITAFQITVKGHEKLEKNIRRQDKEAVDSLVKYKGELLEVRWKEEDSIFVIVTQNGFVRHESSITDCEDVSYVSSPYLPPVLLHTSVEMTDNVTRAKECAKGLTNIRDELDEVIVLDDVRILIGEYVPYGANQVVALNGKLGSSERVQGGLFTALMDTNPDSTTFEVESGLTSVRIWDYDQARFINFEAEVFYPEDVGIIQIENFGVHINADGSLLFGLKVEAVQDRVKNNISLDHLARLLVDVHQDSSKIMDSLLSRYQRSLLDMVFQGNHMNRQKFNIIFAERISPMLAAFLYLDKEDRENELKQVLGDTHHSHQLAPKEVLIMGEQGLLLAGPNCQRHENVILVYLSLKSKDLFMANLFNRTFIVSDTLLHIRTLIDHFEENPNSIPHIRGLLASVSKEIIMLEELLGFLTESLDTRTNIRISDEGDVGAAKLVRVLNIREIRMGLLSRVKDMRKNVEGARHELHSLREMADVASEFQSFKIQEGVQGNTKNLEDVFRSNERTSSSLELMQIILSGTLAFELLDRAIGEWLGGPLWFGVSLVLWAAIAKGLLYFMARLADKSQGVITVRLTPNKKINLDKLKDYLHSKPIQEEEKENDRSGTTKKIGWTEEPSSYWGGGGPRIELTYDEKHKFLLKVFIQMCKADGYLSETVLEHRFMLGLQESGVIDSLAVCERDLPSSLASQILSGSTDDDLGDQWAAGGGQEREGPVFVDSLKKHS